MTTLDTAVPGVCGCGRVRSEPHRCEDRPKWRTPDGLIDPQKVPCPCCGEDQWCPDAWAELHAEVMAAPELAMGTATYGPAPSGAGPGWMQFVYVHDHALDERWWPRWVAVPDSELRAMRTDRDRYARELAEARAQLDLAEGEARELLAEQAEAERVAAARAVEAAVEWRAGHGPQRHCGHCDMVTAWDVAVCLNCGFDEAVLVDLAAAVDALTGGRAELDAVPPVDQPEPRASGDIRADGEVGAPPTVAASLGDAGSTPAGGLSVAARDLAATLIEGIQALAASVRDEPAAEVETIASVSEAAGWIRGERDQAEAALAEVLQLLAEATRLLRHPATAPPAPDTAWWLRRVVECPVCSGPSRSTAGMRCEACGKDYAAPPAPDVPAAPARLAVERSAGFGAPAAGPGTAAEDGWVHAPDGTPIGLEPKGGEGRG